MAEHPGGGRILLVEAGASAAAAATSILEGDGHAVDLVRDGRAALAALEQGSYDVVVTDWNTPRVDGLTLCRAIRDRPELSGVYVLVLTVRGETAQLAESFAAGADDYVPRPFEEEEELLARVRTGVRIAKLQRAQARAEAERERMLHEHLERVGEANRLKDEFLSLVSHELRTPLTSILGYLEILRGREAGELTGEQARFLSVIERNANRLVRLVSDLLFVAQIEAGKLTLEHQDVDLRAVAREAIEAARPGASEKSVDVTLEAENSPRLRGDRTRLTQLVENLVSNAIKFAPEGGRVSVRVARDDGAVELSVADNGIGIAKAEQKHLFERFYRAEAVRRHAIRGSGLGLTITKAIAEAHGGSVKVESDVGRGSTFIVRLPAG